MGRRREQETGAATPEFWRDETTRQRGEFRRQVIRWSLIFALLIVGVFFAFWWAGSAVHFSASRVEVSTAATYRIFGEVRDSGSGALVPWAVVQDDPVGRPPLFSATADVHGAYELITIAEPHEVVASALGYRPKKLLVGRAWYLWMPRGTQRVDITLDAERP